MATQKLDNILSAHSWEQVFNFWSDTRKGGATDKYIDFPYIFALVKTKLACGKGFSFDTKDEQLKADWENISKNSRIQEKISLLLFNIYYYGIAYGGFDKLENGDFRFYAVSQKFFKPYLSKAYEDIIGFNFLKRTMISTGYELVVREKWNLREIEREYWYNKEKITTLGWPTEIPKEYQLPEKSVNPFADQRIIPFQDFPNYTFSDKPDWYPVRNYLPVFNAKVDYLMRELKLNRTRLALRLTPKQKTALENTLKNGKSPADDYIIQVSNAGDINKIAEPIPSTLLINQICTEISNQIKEIFSLSGLSYNNTIENPQTATEVSASQSGLTNTITQSQRAFNENMNILIDKYFRAKGYENPQFSFHLNENTAIDQSTILNETIIALSNGLISKERASAIIYNQTEAEAKIEVDKAEGDITRESKLANNEKQSS